MAYCSILTNVCAIVLCEDEDEEDDEEEDFEDEDEWED